jgi:phosphoglycolate phosphatase
MIDRVLIFDFDGVLADSLNVFEACVQAACRESGVSAPADRAAFLRLFDGNMFAGLQAAGVPASVLPSLIGALRRHLEARAGEYRLWPGVPETLVRLAQTSDIFVVTSGIAGVVAGVLQRHRVTCVRRILGAEEGTGKVEKIRMAAATCLGKSFFYVGDTCGDVLEGRAAGAHTVAAAWGWHDATRLRTTRPDHLLFAPLELAALFGEGTRQDT